MRTGRRVPTGKLKCEHDFHVPAGMIRGGVGKMRDLPAVVRTHVHIDRQAQAHAYARARERGEFRVVQVPVFVENLGRIIEKDKAGLQRRSCLREKRQRFPDDGRLDIITEHEALIAGIDAFVEAADRRRTPDRQLLAARDIPGCHLRDCARIKTPIAIQIEEPLHGKCTDQVGRVGVETGGTERGVRIARVYVARARVQIRTEEPSPPLVAANHRDAGRGLKHIGLGREERSGPIGEVVVALLEIYPREKLDGAAAAAERGGLAQAG